MKFNLIVTGGTFDHFHKGHRDFLDFQFSQSKRVLLGVTTDTFANAKRKDTTVQPYDTRVQAVKKYLTEKGLLRRVEIVPIDSVYIPQEFSDYPIEAIAVTEDTRKGAEVVNEKRRNHGEKELPIIEFTMTLAEDDLPISSTRIREGIISREGELWIKNEWLFRPRFITKGLRNDLKKPFGTLIKNNDYPYKSLDMAKVITVGDIAAKTFLERKLHQKAAIVDFVVEREKKFSAITQIGFIGSENVLTVENPAGQLSSGVFTICKMIFEKENEEKRFVIVVDGEEDLAVLPVLLASPLGYCVFYGQPGEGIVMVDVTEKIKREAYGFVEQFELGSKD